MVSTGDWGCLPRLSPKPNGESRLSPKQGATGSGNQCSLRLSASDVRFYNFRLWFCGSGLRFTYQWMEFHRSRPGFCDSRLEFPDLSIGLRGSWVPFCNATVPKLPNDIT